MLKNRFILLQLIFGINENSKPKKKSKIRIKAFEYHTRAIATPKGIAELEKQLKNHI